MTKLKKEIKTIYVVIGCLFSRYDDGNSASYQVLLTQRREKLLPEIDNLWELPGGKVEPGESPEEAVEREFLEETGYLVKATSCFDRVYTVVRNYPEFTQHTYITCYQCELVSPRRHQVKSDSKISAVKWFNPNEIEYFKVLAGSREFIFDIALKLGLAIHPPSKKLTSLAVFEVIENSNERTRKRFGRKYVITIQFDPTWDKHYMLTTHRGGIYKSGITSNEFFTDYETLIKTLKQRISRRFYNGYTLTSWDNDFPLIEWIYGRNYPIKRKPYVHNYKFQPRLL